MAEVSHFLGKRNAVVSGGNKGIGLEVCRQLASQGVVVVLTSRDEKRGLEAVENLKIKSGIGSGYIEFRQLDVTHPSSIASLVNYIKAKFGKLDILVNNAGIIGADVDYKALATAGFPDAQNDYSDWVKQTYEQGEECLETNYYGVKNITEALLPLLQLSDSPRIVNVSSFGGRLNNIPNEQIRGVLADAENLSEEKVDKILTSFLRDFKDGSLREKGWPSSFSAYIISKAALNAYTRLLSRKYPSFIINCLCPGYVRTDINQKTGPLSVEEGGARVVKLALMPDGSPSGLFYVENEPSSFK